MAATYTPIASINLGAATGTVTFTSIPSGYTDLICIIIGYDVPGNGYLTMQINGDTGTNYSRVTMSGNGSTTSSIRNTGSTVLYPTIGPSSSNIGGDIIHFASYSNTNVFKTMCFRGNQTGNAVVAQAGLWRSTSAITSISFSGAGGNIASGSRFDLYGILGANA